MPRCALMCQGARWKYKCAPRGALACQGGPASNTDPEPKIWAASPDENTPWGPNQAVRSIPRGHGTERLPPSWSLHRVMTSLWSPRVQVTPSRVLHGSEPWAPAGWRRGPHGRLRAVPSSNWNPRTAGPASGARAARNKLPREDAFQPFVLLH